MRVLHIVPIVHSPQDLGRLKDSILSQSLRLYRSDDRTVVTRFWEDLRSAIRTLNWQFKSLYVYQDALPVAEECKVADTRDQMRRIEHQIVEDLAAKGNPNYMVLRWLIDQGAILMGTEDPQLLLEEYRLVQRSIAGPVESSGNATPMALLEKRDAFIADRVNATLPSDGQGLLFLGMLHKVEDKLNSDIEVDFPFGKPDLRGMNLKETY